MSEKDRLLISLKKERNNYEHVLGLLVASAILAVIYNLWAYFLTDLFIIAYYTKLFIENKNDMSILESSYNEGVEDEKGNNKENNLH